MKHILTIMATLFCAGAGAQTMAYPSDIITTRSGGDLKIVFFGHGSIAFEYDGKHIYVDPVSDFADYSTLPKADLVLVGHEHGDHLDPKAIDALSTDETFIIGNGTAIEALGRGTVLEHGEPTQIRKMNMKDAYNSYEGAEAPGIMICEAVEAVPAYNTSPDKLNFHPKARLHNGYLLTFGGTTVYVAGDTEDTPDMLALEGVDIAFLPVNLPYTMTEEQAARAVRAIAPEIFYPYHYGGTDRKTDLGKLADLLEGSGVEMRVRPLE